MRQQTVVQTLWRPGRTLDAEALGGLVAELEAVASTCFDPIPRYQALTGDAEELSRVVIAIARENGRAVGFCSAVLLDVDGIGTVLHLGLTCVAPGARRGGLTHRLARGVVLSTLLRTAPFGSLWISSVACVVSSLTNTALHFDDVHPSPFRRDPPSPGHRAIARAIDERHRAPIAIAEDAVFDEDAFVFRGSVRGSVFQKSEGDGRFHHRDRALSAWYAARMDFSAGDEVVQVGRVSLWHAIRHPITRLVGAWRRTPALPAPGLAAERR